MIFVISNALIRGIGTVSLILALFLAGPIVVAIFEGESIYPFLLPLVGSGLIALGILLLVPRPKKDVTHREGFALVTFSWLLACLIGSVPFVLFDVVPSFADAFFESTSGFTTTGSSVFSEVEALPRSILFWRATTHWLGGMGIIVMAVAVLPMLGISGYRLMQAEAPGPQVERLTPRIVHTARAFWLIYMAFTAVETVLLVVGGLSVFDALTHTFATLATGGFSTRNASIGSFGNAYVEWTITAFMILSGINFALYYRILIRDFGRILKDSQLKAYGFLFTVSVIAVTANLVRMGTFNKVGEAVRLGAFQVATLMTSTGFTTTDYTVWPALSQAILLMMLFVGGCVGSTSGGIKMLHVVVLAKVVGSQFRRLLNPRAVYTTRINQSPLENRTVTAVTSFVFLYLALVLLSTLVVASSGTDILTSLTASLAVIGNIGPGFGLVGPSGNFGFFPSAVKVWLSLVMIMGRLEIYTVLVLFWPRFIERP
jgi:trk system potassium uptake protein TrkH